MKKQLRVTKHLAAVKAEVATLAQEAAALSDAIAEYAEPAMQEFRTAAALCEFLTAHGLPAARPWRSIPTAFQAEAGGAGPVIALLAEYDALPDCGEQPGQFGHGCGHNLLGTAAALAGVVAAKVLAKARSGARIVVYGTPAEETLVGKILMIEKGAFRGLDAALAWHPSARSSVNLVGGSAKDSIVYRFRGSTAHASAGPHQGRSALDAAMLMDVAVNYLREHVEQNCRIHSVITDGGKAPNVVPDRAEIWYYLGGRDRRQVDDLRRRIGLCAKAGAMATETRVQSFVQCAATERIPNRTIADLLETLLGRFGAPEFSAADDRALKQAGVGLGYAGEITPMVTSSNPTSSDEANVSWFVPLSVLNVTCIPRGIRGHHRDYTRTVRLSGAHRGMLRAAEILAAAAVELALNRPLLNKAQAEFKDQMKGKKYSVPRCHTN